MKFSYRFSNLLGTIYRKGNLLFTKDGNTVISPVGNRLSLYNLKDNKSETLPVECPFNFTAVEISPNGRILVAADEDGQVYVISTINRCIIHTKRENRTVNCIRFSPDGKYIAVTKVNNVVVYRAPDPDTRQYNAFVSERSFRGAYDETVCLEWSFDSKLLAVGSKDGSVRLYSMQGYKNFRPYVLGSHANSIIGVFFEHETYDLVTFSSDGVLCLWDCDLNPGDLIPHDQTKRNTKRHDNADNEDGTTSMQVVVQSTDDVTDDPGRFRYKRRSKRRLMTELKLDNSVRLTSAACNSIARVAVTGFSDGSFAVFDIPDFSVIHSFTISDESNSHEISAICLNPTGDWIAMGSATLGQLIVWEWQSQSFVLKQQGHFNNMSCVTYSPDGQYVVTGGEDGKVKLWNTMSSFCIKTFEGHTSGITGVAFAQNGKMVVSSSMDGTVRCFDVKKGRNFRTLTADRPVQFSCVTVDSGSKFVAAGGQDVFNIYMWSIEKGILDILGGHDGPVSSLCFTPSIISNMLVSVSWDKTLRMWNPLEQGSALDTVTLLSDGMCVAFRPDGKEVAVATLDGNITFFDPKTARQSGCIEGRRDLAGGQSETDLISAKKAQQGLAFESLCYTADGTCILAAGKSKHVCIYHVKENILLKKFIITQNRSLDAVDDSVNRRKLTEFGNMTLLEERDDGRSVAVKLPGVRRGDTALRAFRPEVRVYSLQFSPTGQAWSAATTEGLLIYSLDGQIMFDPFELDMSITPQSVKETLSKKEYSTALQMSLRLNEQKLIQEVLENIPVSHISVISQTFAREYVLRLLRFVGTSLESTAHIEFYLLWIQTMLEHHAVWLKTQAVQIMPILHILQKNMTKRDSELSRICDYNKYMMRYLQMLGERKKVKEAEMEVDRVNDESELVI